MKTIVYIVISNGSDGRGHRSTVFASLSEKERDDWYNASPSKPYLYCSEVVRNLDQESYEVWERLDPVHQLCLLRTECPLWQQDYIHKRVGSAGLEVANTSTFKPGDAVIALESLTSWDMTPLAKGELYFVTQVKGSSIHVDNGLQYSQTYFRMATHEDVLEKLHGVHARLLQLAQSQHSVARNVWLS